MRHKELGLKSPIKLVRRGNFFSRLLLSATHNARVAQRLIMSRRLQMCISAGAPHHQPKKVLKMDVEGLTGAATMLYRLHVQKRQMVGRLEVVHLFNKQ